MNSVMKRQCNGQLFLGVRSCELFSCFLIEKTWMDLGGFQILNWLPAYFFVKSFQFQSKAVITFVFCDSK